MYIHIHTHGGTQCPPRPPSASQTHYQPPATQIPTPVHEFWGSTLSPSLSRHTAPIHLLSFLFSGFLLAVDPVLFLTPTLCYTRLSCHNYCSSFSVYFQAHTLFLNTYFVLTGTAMWQCATTTFCHISWRKTKFTQHWSGLPPLYPPPTSPLSFSSSVTLCSSVPSLCDTFLRCPILYLVFLLSSPIVFCLGMLATLQLYSSMHFISIFISDFVIIYSLIYLGLFMHAVCETDSCIYQWNRVRS